MTALLPLSAAEIASFAFDTPLIFRRHAYAAVAAFTPAASAYCQSADAG